MKILTSVVVLFASVGASAGWTKLSEMEKKQVFISVGEQLKAQNNRIGSNCDVSTWGTIRPTEMNYTLANHIYRKSSRAPVLFFSNHPMGVDYQNNTQLGVVEMIYMYMDQNDENIVGAEISRWQPVRIKTGGTSNPQYRLVMQKTLNQNCN